MKYLSSLLLIVFLSFASLCYAEPVNINTADAQTIATEIKGVGMVKAEAIVAYRNEHGLFKTVDELTKVKGIGVRLVEQNKEKMSVE